MKNFRTFLVLLSLSAACAMHFMSCNQMTKNADGEVIDSTALADTVGSVGLNPLPHAPDFPEAALIVSSITGENQDQDSVRITIKYEVNGFQLTEMTDHDHQLANSAEGQHIHFILDNEPYIALYQPEHTFTVAPGSEHVLLSFLSRSFHESLKNDAAYQLVRFKVQADGSVEKLPDLEEVALFYSRPKGKYSGADTQAILLDFYMVNSTLDAANHQVKAEINGQEFILPQWSPYEILNLPMGENKIRLTLIGQDGEDLGGDFVTVERTFHLSED